MFLALLLALSCSVAGAQTHLPPVTQPPAVIAFEPWKEEHQTATQIEYSANFPSAIETAFSVNNVVPLRIFVPADKQGPFPVVIVLHYWGARDLKVERALASRLTSQGVAAVVMTLPYHLARTPPGFASGEMAIQSDPSSLVATMTQSVMDVRRTIDFIASHPEFDSGKIGVSGTSLGSIVSTLSYAVDTRIKAACFILGGVDLAHIIWTSSRVVQQRDELRHRGITEAKLREALAPIEPRELLKTRGPGETYVIGARYDTVVPASNTEQLIAALNAPKVLWLETGHYGGVFAQRKLLHEVSVFFADELQHKPYEPPRHVFAPTVRLGFLASTSTSSHFDVGIGFDLFRSHDRHELFGTVLLTPRGPQGYFGWQIDRGLSIGPVISPQRFGFGIMWSTVL